MEKKNVKRNLCGIDLPYKRSANRVKKEETRKKIAEFILNNFLFVYRKWEKYVIKSQRGNT